MNWALQLNIDQSGNSFNSHLEKQFNLVLPSQPTSPKTNEDRSGKPVAQEIVSVLQEELSSSDRPGKPATEEERHIRNHDNSGKLEREEKTAHSART